MAKTLLDSLSELDWKGRAPQLVGGLVLAVVVFFGLFRVFGGDPVYHIHLKGQARVNVKNPEKLPKGFFKKMRFNVGLGGLRWMVRGDGTIWKRQGDKHWTRIERLATIERVVETDGRYTLDLHLQLPSVPPSCNVRLHREGCVAQQLQTVLKPGPERHSLVGEVGESTLELKRKPRHRKRPGLQTPPTGGEQVEPTDAESESATEADSEEADFDQQGATPSP